MDSGWSLIAEEDGFIITTGSLCYDNSIGCTRIVKTDLKGNVLWIKTYKNTYPYEFDSGGPGSLLKADDEGYYIQGDYDTETMNYQRSLFKINKEGDSLWVKTFGDENEDFANNLLKTDDGNLLLIGYNLDDVLGDFSRIDLIKTDSEGNTILEKELDFGCQYSWPQNITKTNDGNYLLSHRCINDSDPQPAVAKFDEDGNILWNKFLDSHFPLGTSYCSGTEPWVQPLNNGGFALTYCQDTIIPNQPGFYADVLAGFNASGNLLWKSLYLVNNSSNNEIYYMRKASNGDLLLVGRHQGISSGQYNGGWISRISEEGDSLWTRDYVLLDKDWGGSPFLLDITETPDGGLAACGMAFDTTSGLPIDGNIWLLKLDENGCLIPNCNDKIVFISKFVNTKNIENHKQVFFKANPNPVQDYINLDFFNQNFENGKINIFSLDGKLVKLLEIKDGVSHFEFNISDLKDGVYFLTYEEGGIVLQSKKIIKQE